MQTEYFPLASDSVPASPATLKRACAIGLAESRTMPVTWRWQSPSTSTRRSVFACGSAAATPSDTGDVLSASALITKLAAGSVPKSNSPVGPGAALRNFDERWARRHRRHATVWAAEVHAQPYGRVRHRLVREHHAASDAARRRSDLREPCRDIDRMTSDACREPKGVVLCGRGRGQEFAASLRCRVAKNQAPPPSNNRRITIVAISFFIARAPSTCELVCANGTSAASQPRFGPSSRARIRSRSSSSACLSSADVRLRVQGRGVARFPRSIVLRRSARRSSSDTARAARSLHRRACVAFQLARVTQPRSASRLIRSRARA